MSSHVLSLSDLLEEKKKLPDGRREQTCYTGISPHFLPFFWLQSQAPSLQEPVSLGAWGCHALRSCYIFASGSLVLTYPSFLVSFGGLLKEGECYFLRTLGLEK